MSGGPAAGAMWIKICGLTTPDAVAAALDLGVDAIGFVFSDSSRRVTPARAAALARPARGRVKCVAVARRTSPAEVEAILRDFAPDVLQLDAGELASLDLPQALELLPVFRSGAPDVEPRLSRLLFEGPDSGTGERCDWTQARRLSQAHELVLAGGLTAANVGEAIRAVTPFGVDVSSGVEDAPGRKSPVRMAQFVAAVRQAISPGKDLPDRSPERSQ